MERNKNKQWRKEWEPWNRAAGKPFSLLTEGVVFKSRGNGSERTRVLPFTQPATAGLLLERWRGLHPYVHVYVVVATTGVPIRRKYWNCVGPMCWKSFSYPPEPGFCVAAITGFRPRSIGPHVMIIQTVQDKYCRRSNWALEMWLNQDTLSCFQSSVQSYPGSHSY